MPKPRNTIRKGKKSKTASTQRYLPISEIRNDTVILKHGGLRAVLEVEPLNFNLKSETEQLGIISGYESFLNTLTFPVQILVRSTKVNIDPYIDQVRNRADQQTNPLLKEQTQAYASFVERIVDVADIMQKRFLIVVPLDELEEKRSSISQFFSWIGLDDSSARIQQRRKYFAEKAAKLKDRVNLIESGLRNIGLIPRRLTTMELIELYYEVYNPRTSQEQKLPKELSTDSVHL